jgi:hypothetical protein
MYVYIYVMYYVCIYVCLCAYMYVIRTNPFEGILWMNVCMCLCMCVCMHISCTFSVGVTHEAHICCIYTYTWSSKGLSVRCVNTYIHTRTHTYIHAGCTASQAMGCRCRGRELRWVLTYIHTYIYTYILTYIHTSIVTYACVYIHAWLHMYGYMHLLKATYRGWADIALFMYSQRNLHIKTHSLHTCTRT